MSQPEINPDDLEPTIEVELKIQKRILLLHARMASEDHYALLGVSRTAEKKEIKAAYFDLMSQFHTDKFYGKNLGGFERRLQQIVERLTKANDVLGRKKTRAEYDQYLSSRETTIGARNSIAPAGPSSSPPESDTRAAQQSVEPTDVVPTIPRAPRAPLIDRQSPAESERRSRQSPQSDQQPPSSNSSSPPTSRNAPNTRNKDAARRMLARKMGRRAPSANGSKTPNATSTEKSDPQKRRMAVDADLKARYQARMGIQPEKAAKYVDMASEAKASGDWSAAVKALRMAASCAPDDGAIKRRLNETQTQADSALAPKFLEQAKYEEKDGHPQRAARSYERAARGKKSALLFNKAALCLLTAEVEREEERRKTVEMAREAVTLDNKNAAYRITLARAYDVAGMRTSAQGEARRALELEPNNDDAKRLNKELR